MVKITFPRTVVFASCMLGAASSFAQFSFTNANSLIPTATHSGCAITVVDVNNDGLDDLVKMDQGTTLLVDLQKQNGTYTHYSLGNITGGSRVWGMAVADVDHNGWKDVATGTNGSMYLVKLAWSGTTITATTTTLGGSYFVQNVTFGDFNNDGWVDLAVCDDVDYMKIYKNTTGTLALQTPTTAMINTNINPGMTYSGDPYDSGNYGSVWLDFDNDGDLDLYIAHCRQSTSSSTDQRRRDRLFVNNGSNVYTEAAATYGIEVTNFRQTWTTSFGDIDNDGDFDVLMMNHTGASQILENDGAGHFTDITATTGFSWNNDGIESILEDFDNDGYVDILMSGGGSGDSYWVYRNNGNKTFTALSGTFPSQSNGMLSFATGDLNHDGQIDVLASYGNVYNTPTTTNDVLYLNNTNNGNHFITFNLTGTVSNKSAIGARVTITGAFGTQVREVRAGETYGTANSMQLHFGLGSNTSITSATIDWPAGGTTNFGALNADQFVTAVEGTCTITGNVIPGPIILCTGQSTTMTAASGYPSYLWSTGATTQSISTSTAGTFNVMVTSGTCTNISPTVGVTLNPDETPTVTSMGATSCAGTYTLSSTPASAYAWSGPGGFTATSQTINPPTSGTYSLTITGTCASFSATPVSVSVLAAPSPTGTGASGPGPASFNLSATGTGGSLTWYDMPTGGTLLTTGTSYTTPVISATTTYYVEDATTYPGSLNTTGKAYQTGSSAYSATTINGALDFDVMGACTLNSVKVYTGTFGTREIRLLNSSGTVIDSMTVNLTTDTTVVNLNFALTPGTNYRLTTDGALNNTNFGAVSPVMKRSTSGVTYPYTVSGLVSITQGWTGTATSSTAYYYFYDWKVASAPTVCTSSRIPVTATVTTLTGIAENNANSIATVYPNPATDNLTVSLNKSVTGKVSVTIVDLAGRIVSEQSFSATEKIELNIAGLAKGTYMVKVAGESAQSVQRVVKN
ncbi:MAG: ASPIC/UnbV protein [Bacteroidetes bacterium]|nr:ASPIC/UnbV protein [Bacteroidota bacterium]